MKYGQHRFLRRDAAECVVLIAIALPPAYRLGHVHASAWVQALAWLIGSACGSPSPSSCGWPAGGLRSRGTSTATFWAFAKPTAAYVRCVPDQALRWAIAMAVQCRLNGPVMHGSHDLA